MENNKSYFFFETMILFVLTFAIVSDVDFYLEASSLETNSFLSVEQYDKSKNCSTDLQKKPDSIEYLTHFNCGLVKNVDNQTVRQFTLIIDENQKIPISHSGHVFNGWTFNGTIPGPTIRVTEGDLVKITVVNSENNELPHSFHTHSIHPAEMDGVSMGNYSGGFIKPGESFTYEFIARPYGVYPYHCHVDPIADHINRGLYGVMIIDPKEPRSEMTEFVMTMNAYDMNYDQEGPIVIPSMDEIYSEDSEIEERDNEIYTVNGKAFDYIMNPISIETGKSYRIYLVNMVEFDLINSFHLHGNMFKYIVAGTDESPDFLTDVITLGQGDRGILEFKYDYPGKYMFHAHVTEFTDLGWMGFFDVNI